MCHYKLIRRKIVPRERRAESVDGKNSLSGLQRACSLALGRGQGLAPMRRDGHRPEEVLWSHSDGLAIWVLVQTRARAERAHAGEVLLGNGHAECVAGILTGEMGISSHPSFLNWLCRSRGSNCRYAEGFNDVFGVAQD